MEREKASADCSQAKLNSYWMHKCNAHCICQYSDYSYMNGLVCHFPVMSVAGAVL